MVYSLPLTRIIVLFILSGLVFSSGCKRDPSLNYLSALPDETLLNIPTYDGSGQCVHPDILFLDPPVNDNRFMLAFTPYPDFNDKVENPSVLLSSNGVDYHEPVQGINPLVPTPGYDHNDDPDLLYDESQHKYYLHYLKTMRPDSEDVVRLESSDGISWTPHVAVHFDLKGGDPLIVSPAIVLQNDRKSYLMYYVNLNDPSGTYTIQTLLSNDGINWDKKMARYINSDLPPGLVPWHIDVIRSKNEYIMLLSARLTPTTANHEKLMMATSTDGLNWHFRQMPLMDSDPAFHNCLSMYRSSALVQDNLMVVWYSMVDINNQWHIGLKKFDRDTL